MKYPDFKDAAARHILSCNYILNMLDLLKEHEKRLLLWNTYYLSGYIVECSLKFAFFKGIRYDRSKDIEDLNYVFGEREYNFERIKNQQHNLVSTIFLASRRCNFRIRVLVSSAVVRKRILDCTFF
jgi:hypothetical protein